MLGQNQAAVDPSTYKLCDLEELYELSLSCYLSNETNSIYLV
jgi:hypothetical protein